ncbi:MAG: hypothetical protein DWQ44_09035 [Bacteroidetes bacterium]|nr:MAG: hypothetical protein DWQ33_02740 [Bacteroidota bacterium]REK06434.1 MAG: hypothetical protein DWQ39_02825 [Bacteroidota bacterium]REK33200.1 MAG: hypothetical protein DWQ44_09035 [Bacteroidota bacterium]REK47037.1 MAG: hypothetical protein DWQ48_13370 [Bacteroidota bacterium]
MAKQKIKGYIEKWRTKTRWYVHVLHLNRKISDLSVYKTAGGRNKKVRRLLELYTGYIVRNRKK